MYYSPFFDPKTDADTRWSVSEAREFELPPQRLEALMHDTLFAVLGRAPERTEGEPATWRVPLVRRLSVFDEWELVVVLTSRDDLAHVEVTVSFAATEGHVGAFLWVSQSLIGLPASLAWRALSIRDARAFARATSRKLWAALGAHAGRAYR